MNTEKIIAAASEPAFYTKVAFLALKAAQEIASEPANTANHTNRVAYASRIFAGQDKALLVALHVVASNPTITKALDLGKEVSDGDISFALASIWDARANAFAPAPAFEPIAPGVLNELQFQSELEHRMGIGVTPYEPPGFHTHLHEDGTEFTPE